MSGDQNSAEKESSLAVQKIGSGQKITNLPLSLKILRDDKDYQRKVFP
jgi:hypothetical protein